MTWLAGSWAIWESGDLWGKTRVKGTAVLEFLVFELLTNKAAEKTAILKKVLRYPAEPPGNRKVVKFAQIPCFESRKSRNLAIYANQERHWRSKQLFVMEL
jgi:hypothetical protein